MRRKKRWWRLIGNKEKGDIRGIKKQEERYEYGRIMGGGGG